MAGNSTFYPARYKHVLQFQYNCIDSICVNSQWTDDTSMALCLCESIVECGGRFDPADQCSRYYRWFQVRIEIALCAPPYPPSSRQDGHLSSTGECFDIGMTTQKALLSSTRSLDPYCGPTGTKAAGNGCLMRLAPVPLAYWTRPLLALEHAGDSARTTHGASAAIDSCRWVWFRIIYI